MDDDDDDDDDDDEIYTSEKSVLPPVLHLLLFLVVWTFQFRIFSAALGALIIFITFLDYCPLLLTVISFGRFPSIVLRVYVQFISY